MFFRDIIGQDDIKQRLIRGARSGKVAHAQLFYGEDGRGSLPMALAYAQYLSCQNPMEEDSCGSCPSCKKFANLSHPDLHLVFPVVKRKSTDAGLSDEFIQQFREAFLSQPYMSLQDWQREVDETKVARIYTREADNIISKLTLKPFEADIKTMIIWGAEKMEEECANKLLKVLEEPQGETLFVLISPSPDELLQTIRSRTQQVFFPPIEEQALRENLQATGLYDSNSENHIKNSRGNYNLLLKNIEGNEAADIYFGIFKQLMRASWSITEASFKEMFEPLIEQLVALGRSGQIAFLQHAQRGVRESFIYNLNEPQLIYMNDLELDFAKNFARFINERNIEELASELALAQAQIEQNVNAKYVFMDMVLQINLLMKK